MKIIFLPFSIHIVMPLFSLFPFKLLVLGPASSLQLFQLVKSHDVFYMSDAMVFITSTLKSLFSFIFIITQHCVKTCFFFCRLVWEIHLLTASELLLKCHATSSCSQMWISIPDFAARTTKC